MENTSKGINRRLHRVTLLQVTIRALLVAALTTLFIWLFYHAALNQQRDRLNEIAANQAGLIEAMAAHVREHGVDDLKTVRSRTLQQLKVAHKNFPGLGQTGEFTLAQLDGRQIDFLLRHRHNDIDKPRPVPMSSTLAVPMREALSGHMGTMEGLDYRGKPVLAAYHPIPELGWGIVAKMDLEEVNAPYIHNGWIVVLLATLFTSGSAFFAIRSVKPIMRALTDSEERYRILVQKQSDMIISFAPDLKLTFVSNNYCETFGRREDELLHNDFLSLIHKDDRPRILKSLESVAHYPYKATHEERALTRSGWRWFQWSVQALLNGSNEVREIIAVGRDITDRKEAELERDKSMQLLKQHAVVFDNAVEAVFITDNDGTILSANPSFSRITGYEPEEVLGKNVRILKSGRQQKNFYREMFDNLQQYGKWEGEIWNRRKGGEIFPVWETISRVDGNQGDEEGELRYIGIFSDISDRKFEHERLSWLAYHDGLTGLPNRLLFRERCEHALIRTRRSGKKLAIMFIDLDNFKPVNDTLGHSIGDQILQKSSQRLSAVIRKQDTVSRLGGDEFAILLEEIDDRENAREIADKLVLELQSPFDVGDNHIHLGASIGVVVYPDIEADWEQLINLADNAMYEAKRRGRGCFAFAESSGN